MKTNSYKNHLGICYLEYFLVNEDTVNQAFYDEGVLCVKSIPANSPETVMDVGPS